MAEVLPENMRFNLIYSNVSDEFVINRVSASFLLSVLVDVVFSFEMSSHCDWSAFLSIAMKLLAFLYVIFN